VKKKRIVGNNALTAEVESPPALSGSSETRTEVGVPGGADDRTSGAS